MNIATLLGLQSKIYSPDRKNAQNSFTARPYDFDAFIKNNQISFGANSEKYLFSSIADEELYAIELLNINDEEYNHCDKETHDAIRSAIADILNNQNNLKKIDPTINTSSINKLGIIEDDKGENTRYPYNTNADTPLSFDDNTAELKLNKPNNDINNFAITLEKYEHENKTMLVAIDKIGQKYLAYKGIVVPIKEVQEIDSHIFSSWGNLSKAKQSEILAQAAEEFMFNLIDKNGKPLSKVE